MEPARRGVFVTFEGIDGAGKSTQLASLAEAVRATGREVVTTREPGGTPGAEAIRALLVEGAADRWSAEAEALLFTAARRDHVDKVIGPALARGAVVLCDRYVDSTRAYQGDDPERLAAIEALHAAHVRLDPDVTLLLDLDPGAAADRAGARGEAADRFEGRGAAFREALRARFLALAAAEPGRIRIVEAGADAETVAARVRAVAGPLLGLG